MLKRFMLTAIMALPVLFAQTALFAQGPAASEEEKTRPNRQEITDLMIQALKMSAQQQAANLDRIMAEQAGSKTPRSDFMFCTGLAYLGNAKAQACVAKAYESGIGIVEDSSEAYTWYALACEARIADAAEALKLEEARDQLKLRLLSAYPHPTEEELEDQANAQKARIAQYQAEIKKAK